MFYYQFLGCRASKKGLWGLRGQHIKNDIQNNVTQKLIKIIWFHAEIASKCCYTAYIFLFFASIIDLEPNIVMTHTPAHKAEARGAVSETFCACRGRHSMAWVGTANISKWFSHRKPLTPACRERQKCFAAKWKFLLCNQQANLIQKAPISAWPWAWLLWY